MNSRIRRCLLVVGVLMLWTIGSGQQSAPSPAPLPATQPATTQTAFPSGANVAVIRIEGLIYDFTLESLQRRVDRALAVGASVIVIELDTPGGLLESALKISGYIKTLPVPTVAWIHPRAYSAGILIASACNQIVMSPGSATGDAAPIVMGQNLSPTERAKALSPLLAEFRANAQAGGHDYVLLHAMAELGVEVYLIEDPKTGQQRLVNQADYQIMVQGQSIASVLATTAPSNPDLSNSVSPSLATEDQRGQWKLVRQVHNGKTLLTVTEREAQDIGLSKAVIRSESELQRHYQAAQVLRINQSWSESLAGWLTSPVIRGVLVIALLLGAYIEFQTPGIGLAGAVAAIALILLLVAPLLVGLAEIWHILVFFVGLVLLFIEVFVTPGFGVLGITGLIMIFGGLALAIVPTSGSGFSLPPPEVWGRLQQSVLWMVLGLIGSLVGFYYLTKYFGRIPGLNRMILRSPEPEAAAAMAGAEAAVVSGDEVIGHGYVSPGQTGRAVSSLRPSGRAEIGGRVVDVVAVGQWIEAGQSIKVIEVSGNRIVVERA